MRVVKSSLFLLQSVHIYIIFLCSQFLSLKMEISFINRSFLYKRKTKSLVLKLYLGLLLLHCLHLDMIQTAERCGSNHMFWFWRQGLRFPSSSASVPWARSLTSLSLRCSKTASSFVQKSKFETYDLAQTLVQEDANCYICIITITIIITITVSAAAHSWHCDLERLRTFLVPLIIIPNKWLLPVPVF